MFFKNLCVLVLWTKAASALEGLKTDSTVRDCMMMAGQSSSLDQPIGGDYTERGNSGRDTNRISHDKAFTLRQQH